MKFGPLLLTLLIIFLSIKSVIEPAVAIPEIDACCKKDTGSNKDSCDGLCNPFQPCCPYVTFPANILVISIPNSYPSISEKIQLYNVAYHSSYSADFWQPPRLV